MWTFIFLILLSSIIFGTFTSLLASKKGYSATSWFWLGFLFSIIALLVAIGLPNKTIMSGTSNIPLNTSLSRSRKPSEFTIVDLTKRCPDCAEIIKIDARVCRYCGRKFSKQEIIEEYKKRLKQTNKEEALYKQIVVALATMKDTWAINEVKKNQKFYKPAIEYYATKMQDEWAINKMQEIKKQEEEELQRKREEAELRIRKEEETKNKEKERRKQAVLAARPTKIRRLRTILIILILVVGVILYLSYKTSLCVSSVPTGAKIYIDDKYTGRETPNTIHGIIPGKHTLRLAKKGYKDFSGPFTIRISKVKSVITKLSAIPIYGFLSITSTPSEASVYMSINGVSVKRTTPCKIQNLKSGVYDIVVKKQGYKDYLTTVKIDSGRKTDLAIRLVKEPPLPQVLVGKISISSNPTSAKVYVDGKYKGITPLSISLKVGNHVVKITKLNYKDYNKTIDIKQNEKTSILATLSVLMSYSWKEASEGLVYGTYERIVYSLTIDPKNTNVIYAGTAKSVFKSTNGGTSWTKMSNGLTDTDVFSLAIDPKNTNVIYAGTHNDGIFKSVNGGASWKKINNGLPGTTVRSLAINPKNTNMIYAGTTDGVFKSTNGGTSWTKMSNGLTDTDVFSLAIDPKNTNVIYAGTHNDGIFKSVNGGASWKKISRNKSSTSTVTSLAIDPKNTNVIYAGLYGNGVFKSTNNGTSWIPINDGLTSSNMRILSLAIDQKNTNVIYAAIYNSGVFKSTNNGTSWIPINDGLTSRKIFSLLKCISIFSLAIDPKNTDVIYAGTGGGGIFKCVFTSP